RLEVTRSYMTSPLSSIPPSTLTEESDIPWKLTLLFPDLRVMVSNLIVALVVVRNGVPKMKDLFSFSLISN
ncbi:hypothetical protein Tco_0612521, partial [Tanacetum coccineum]